MSADEISPFPWKTRKPSPSCVFDADGEVVAMVSHLQPGNRAVVRAAPSLLKCLEEAEPLIYAAVQAETDKAKRQLLAAQLERTQKAIANAKDAL